MTVAFTTKKQEYDKAASSLAASRYQVQVLNDRLAALPRERARRKHTGEYWPAFVIVIPYAVFMIFAGFLAIILKFSFFWSVCLSIPITLIAFIVALGLFHSRTEALIDADQADIEEKLRQFEPEIKTLESEYNLYSSLYEAARNELLVETNRRDFLTQKLQALESQISTGLLGPENWRHLRGVDFEMFLKRLFESLGYHVELTPASNDYGIDLIVSGNGIRVAVQAKGYEGSVSNSAVQEAYTGMSYHRCTECAVITNSSFTRNAIELANRVGCQLIGESELDQLIRGEISIM